MNGKETRPALRLNPQTLVGLIACLWIIMGSFPTGWLYDIGVGSGTEQGQKPNSDVSQLHEQGDVEWLFWQQEPTTVTGHDFISCPLMRLGITFVVVITVLAIEKMVKCRLAKFLEVRCYE